ncbi:MAG: hypothetical protein ACM3SY_02180 [Candidatus Omnitrophota bacterium]
MTSETESINQKLVLIEFPDEVETFLDYCQKNALDPASFLLIALQPSVTVSCKEKNLSSIDTLSFFTNESHVRAVRESHRMTRVIKEKLEFPGDLSLKNTLLDTFIYYSRFYINNYLRILEIMIGIKQRYPSAVVYAVRKHREPDPDPWMRWGQEPFLSKRDRLVAPMVEVFCKHHGMAYVEIPAEASKPASKPSKLKNIFKTFMKPIARVLVTRKLRKLSETGVALFAAPSYNLTRVCHDIRWRFPHVMGAFITQQNLTFLGYIKVCFKRMKKTSASIPLSLFDPGPKRKTRATLDRLKESYQHFMSQWGNTFVYENCPFIETWNRNVTNDLLMYLYYLCRLARGQQTILENLKPGIVISPVATAFFQSWGELARKSAIPAIVIPQKGLLVPRNEYAKIEEYHIGRAQVTDDFDHAAAQSPLTAGYMKWAGYKGKIMETANLIFSRVDITTREKKRITLFPHIPFEKKIIVYAPSMKSRKSCRFYVLETLDELLASLRDVMHAVAKIPDTHLVVRIHPGEPITPKEIETLLDLPPNVTISNKGTFEDTLSAADLVVSFSSTIIQESLLNGIPVALYDKWKRYNHLDAPHVHDITPDTISAAYYIDDPQYLHSAMRWIIDQHENGNHLGTVFKDYVFPSRYTELFYDYIKECCQK